MEELALQVVVAVLSAAMYASIWYGRARQKGETFDPMKFGSTLIVGAFVGLTLGLAGTQVTFPTIEAQLAGYAGLIAMVEGILKTVYPKIQEL